MKVVVCGGRDFTNMAYVFSSLNRLHDERPITALMQGGATGADALARDWAVSVGIARYVCRANWQKYGKAAGPMRNARMLEWAPDMVVAFPGGNGTADMVQQARDAGVEVLMID